ncbi:MAG: methyltransferase domain-containing protein [Flavobacteriaceae bacterium]|nr:methyltransferase domain-containing protein [Flavobacteriaceae bacterium]
MKVIKLPTIPNSPVKNGESSKEGDFLLKKFGSFGFVQNILFDESIIDYDEKYQNNQSISTIFQNHMNSVYQLLKTNFPKGSKLVEVGCGKGSFLDIVRIDGHFQYKGYDKTYEGDDENIEARYLVHSDTMEADVVVLRHTLEHIKEPYLFLKFLCNVFINKETYIFIEVPQFGWIEENNIIFDFTYEHVNYFNKESLCSLFSQVDGYGDLFAGQYQYCLARLNSLVGSEWTSFNEEAKWSDFDFNEYVEKFRSNVTPLYNFERIWVWGGATKGVLFLKHLSDLFPEIFCKVVGVVDINPKKQGLFTPSTNIEIVPPSRLFFNSQNGDGVIVMNPNYIDEVEKEIQQNVKKSVKVLAL